MTRTREYTQEERDAVFDRVVAYVIELGRRRRARLAAEAAEAAEQSDTEPEEQQP